MSSRRPPSRSLWPALALLAGCVAESTNPELAPADAAPPDGAAAPPDTGRPADAARPPDAGPDAAADAAAPVPPDASPWVLSACEAACDRLTDCAVDACVGYDWSAAGALGRACLDACGPSMAGAVDAAPSCEAALDVARSHLAGFQRRCEDSTCEAACGRLAECVVAECPAIGPDVRDPIAADCRSRCEPANVAWVLEAGRCGEVVGAISANDPNFRRACEGGGPRCPPADICQGFGAKLAECLVANCGDAAAPYRAGLVGAFRQHCMEAQDCPSLEDARALAGLGCDHAALREFGTAEPFTALCEGRIGVEPDALRAACERLSGCAGGPDALDVEVCMVHVGLGPDAPARTGCVAGSSDCERAWECLR